MIYLLFSCIILIISIILFIFRQRINKKVAEKNADLKISNETLSDYNNVLTRKCQELTDNIVEIGNELAEKDNELSEKENKLTTLDALLKQEQEQVDRIQGMFDKNKEMAFEAFEQWWKNLENSYFEKEKEYDQNIQKLKTSSEEERAAIEKELDKIRQIRTAAIEALKREQEIKEKISFYCLQVTPAEISDIQKLEAIKPQLNNPRILSMLIWSTYFQKPMTSLCNNVIGTTVKSGIYKITNQKTNICYIGQAVDIAARWKSHAKCGLGIDTPANNPLYKAMIADGIWNFSFEVLEECSKEELNEKEKYYIQLYQSKDFGYNSTIGNK